MPPGQKNGHTRRPQRRTKVLVLTVILMLSFTLPVSSDDRPEVRPNDKPDDDVLIKEAVTSLNLKNASCVVFVGKNDAGINELKKFLRHDETLTVEKVKNKFKLDAHEEKTFVPSVSVDLESRSRMFTLTDNEPDLPAQFFNKRILESAGGLKVTMVQSFATLSGDLNYETLSNAVKNVVEILGSKLEWYKDSLCLVVTKVDVPNKNDTEIIGDVEYQVEEFVKFTNKLRDEAQLNNDEELVANLESQIAVCNYLLKKNRFGILRTPKAKKSPWDLPPLKKNFNQLRKLIFQKMEYSSRIGSAAEIVVTASTLKKVENQYVPSAEDKMNEILSGFAVSLEEALYGKLFGLFESFTTNFFPTAFDRLTTFAHLESLVNLLEVPSKQGEDVASVAYLINFYYDILGKSFEKYQLREITDCKSEFRIILSDFTDNHAFLASLRRDHDTRQVQEHLVDSPSALVSGLSVENFQTWQKGLANLGFSENTTKADTKGNEVMVQKIQTLAQSVPANEAKNATEGVLLYSGYYVFLSQVRNLLNNATHEVEIVAMRKLFVDCDLELKDTHMTIWAPVMEVDRRWTKFTLQGSDAPPTPNTTAGTNGADGFSSGKFHLVVSEIVNPKMLVFEAYGGSGADGIDGIDGAYLDLDGYFEPGACFRSHENHVWDRRDEINRNWGPKYKSSVVKTDCDIDWNFHERCEYDATVTKNFDETPEPGTNGGNAGTGATPGDIIVNEKVLCVKRNGTNGNPGIGGQGGIVLAIERKFDCRTVRWYNDLDCWSGRYTSHYKNASAGESGNPPAASPVTNYQHLKQRVPFDAFIRLNLLAVYSPSPISPVDKFLNFATSEEIVEKFSTKNFFEFLGAVQDAFVNTIHTANLKIVARSVYESFTIFKKLGKESDSSYLDLIELMFVDTLSKCDSLSTPRQVVKLSNKIKNEISRLNQVKDIKQDLFVYETLKEEGEKAAIEIIEAEMELQEFYDGEMADVGKEIDLLLDELVANVYEEQNEYEENIAELQRDKEEYQKAMRRKKAFKTLGWSFKIAGAFYPVAGVAGSAMLALGNAGSSGGSNIEELLPDISHAADNAALVIAEYWLEREMDVRSKQEAQLQAIQLFLDDTDIETEVLTLQEYENARQVVNEASNLEDVEDEKWSEFYQTFDSVELKIESAKGQAENEDDLVKLSVYGTVFKASKEGFLLAKDVFSFVSEIRSGNAQREMFDAAIEANKVAIEQLETYREMIDTYFIPMLEDMRDRLNNMQTELEDAHSVLTGIKAFEMKKKIREFQDFVTRFTDGLLEEDGFAALSAQLQDVVSVLAEGYDKIDEIGYRLEMKQFMGTITGGDCSQATDLETCNAYLAARAEVEKSHLLVAFIDIFAAYQQVIFPFDTEKNKILGNLVDKLRNNSLGSDAAIRQVQLSLSMLRTKLDDMSTTITNQDKDIIYAIFNPKYKTGKPFFTWHAGNEHLTQVENLFNGKEVSLVASVAPKDERNAIKFKFVTLNFTSTDPKVNSRVQDLLLSYRLEATHVGPSHYHCGTNNFAIGGNPLQFSVTYERDEFGNPIEINEALSKLKNGDVPLSPYTVWRFRLEYIASDDEQDVREELLTMAGLLDLQLIGEGYYIKEDADICRDANNGFVNIARPFLK